MAGEIDALAKRILEACAKVADAKAAECRTAAAKCSKWSPAKAEWLKACDTAFTIAKNIRALEI